MEEHAMDRNGKEGGNVSPFPANGTAVNEFRCHEFPSVTFAPFVPNVALPDPPRSLPLALRLFRFFRKLVRRRQDSAALKAERRMCLDAVLQASRREEAAIRDADLRVKEFAKSSAKQIEAAEKRVANRDARIEEMKQLLDRKTADWELTLSGKERDIKDLLELQIPKLEREIEVERRYNEILANKLNLALARLEAEIAVENRRVIDADETESVEDNPMQRLLRGER